MARRCVASSPQDMRKWAEAISTCFGIPTTDRIERTQIIIMNKPTKPTAIRKSTSLQNKLNTTKTTRSNIAPHGQFESRSAQGKHSSLHNPQFQKHNVNKNKNKKPSKS